MKKEIKKSNAAKKLVPATCMLLVSATMLASSTYAWFTMSREVEVKGIHMTATVPETLQISLGKLTNGDAGLTSTNAKINDTSKRLYNVVAPDDDEYWTNVVDISEYYQFGHLTPATSTDGLKVWYTGDANGSGKTLKGQSVGADGKQLNNTDTIAAAFTMANASDNKLRANSSGTDASGHTAAVALVNNRTATADTLTGDNDPYKDGVSYDTSGCYIDVPVWIRTSAASDQNLGVIATFTAGSNDYTKDSGSAKADQIFKAARVSILEGNNDNVTNSTTRTDGATQGVIRDSSSGYYRTANGAELTGDANPYTVSDYASSTITWGAVTTISQATADDLTADGKIKAASSATVNTVMKATAPTSGTTYGDACPYTIRIWLDGEDVDCWNATAGQDFNINLRFIVKEPAPASP